MGLIVSTCVFTQEDLQVKVDALKAKISNVNDGEKLQLMDSLVQLIGYHSKPEFKYDSIIRATIDLAIKQQDYNRAAKLTGELIFVLVNLKGNSEEGLKLFKATLNKNWEITDKSTLAVLYSGGADSFLESGLEAESIHYYEAAEKLFLGAKDSIQYAKVKGYKAYALSLMGEFASASQEYQKALSVFMNRGDNENILKLRIGLSILYSQNRFYDEAEKEYLAIDSLSFGVKDYGAYLANLGNMAYDYAVQGAYKKSIACNKRKLAVIDLHPEFDFFAPYSFQALALDYTATDSLDKARLYIHKLKAFLDRDPENYGLKDLYIEAETQLLLAEGDLSKAEAKAKALLDMRQGTKDYEVIMEVHELLYGIYEAKKNQPQALKHLKVYTKIKDSIESVQKARALSYYQTLYETEKRDAKIASQESEISILDEKNKVKRQWIVFGGLGLLALFSIIYLVRTKRFAVTKQKMQESFSQNLIQEQERERSRLARELHDSVGQKLMLLSKSTKARGDTNVEALAKDSLAEVRAISRGLHPSNLERLGLTEAINALIYDINANTELFFTEDIDNIDNVLSKDAELHVYRIIQESLSNIVKHAEAKAVKMEVKKGAKGINVVLSDNGKGFDFESKYKSMSLGLKTLFERAKIIDSRLHLSSEFNKGTTLTLTIPI